jgi:hypothetical protein
MQKTVTTMCTQVIELENSEGTVPEASQESETWLPTNQTN